jgi:hypothetical protein
MDAILKLDRVSKSLHTPSQSCTFFQNAGSWVYTIAGKNEGKYSSEGHIDFGGVPPKRPDLLWIIPIVRHTSGKHFFFITENFQ